MGNTIGVFDSGIGGLTVVKELMKVHPTERIVYFGDTARVPYGSKSVEIIRRYAKEDTELLLQHNPKLLIVACGTMSAVALDVVQQTAAGIEVIGMIGPTCSDAIAATGNNKIGIIGTEATIASKAYERGLTAEAATVGKTVETLAIACPLFVPIAEEGWQDHPATGLIVKEYLQPLVDAGIDTLILGCTHYPVLRTVIASVMGPSVTLINSGEATAKRISSQGSNGTAPEHLIMVSDIPRKFQSIGERFLGHALPTVKQAIYKEAWVVV